MTTLVVRLVTDGVTNATGNDPSRAGSYKSVHAGTLVPALVSFTDKLSFTRHPLARTTFFWSRARAFTERRTAPGGSSEAEAPANRGSMPSGAGARRIWI